MARKIFRLAFVLWIFFVIPNRFLLTSIFHTLKIGYNDVYEDTSLEFITRLIIILMYYLDVMGFELGTKLL